MSTIFNEKLYIDYLKSKIQKISNRKGSYTLTQVLEYCLQFEKSADKFDIDKCEKIYNKVYS